MSYESTPLSEAEQSWILAHREGYVLGYAIGNKLRADAALEQSAVKDAKLAVKDEHIQEITSLAFKSVIQNQKRIEKVEEDSNKDPLTGVLNRQGLELEYSKLFPGKKIRKQDELQTAMPMPIGCIFFFDIDNFKMINDSLGHSVGDQVLISVFGAIKGRLRERDIFGRYGGDEGLGILPRTSLEDMEIISEDVRKAVADIQYVAGFPVSLSVSIGVDKIDPELPFELGYKKADKAMYEAKRNGRNQVQFTYA